MVPASPIFLIMFDPFASLVEKQPEPLPKAEAEPECNLDFREKKEVKIMGINEKLFFGILAGIVLGNIFFGGK